MYSSQQKRRCHIQQPHNTHWFFDLNVIFFCIIRCYVHSTFNSIFVCSCFMNKLWYILCLVSVACIWVSALERHLSTLVKVFVFVNRMIEIKKKHCCYTKLGSREINIIFLFVCQNSLRLRLCNILPIQRTNRLLRESSEKRFDSKTMYT